MKRDSFVLYEKTAAGRFEESFLIGNGSLGASVYSDPINERIFLNSDTLWTGHVRSESANGNRVEALDKVKELVANKKYREACAAAESDFSSYASDAYLPMAELDICFSKKEEKLTRYKRTLDLSRAICRSSYIKGVAKYNTEAFVSYPDKAFAWRTECAEGSFSLIISLSTRLYGRSYTQGKRLYLEGECPVSSQKNISRTNRKTLYYDDPEKRGIRFMCGLSLDTDGLVKDGGDSLEIIGATFIDIRIVSETSFNGYKKHPYLEGKPYRENCIRSLDRVSAIPYGQMKNRHEKDFSSRFTVSKLDLGSSERSSVPTSIRLLEYQKGVEDKGIITLLYNFGKYLTVSASRKGSEAMNLQGIWNPHFFAPWHSNYTLNINTEMNYFPTLSMGLNEEFVPYVNLIRDISEKGRETAKKFYGAEGWVCHHNSDLWRYTEPVSGSSAWSFWNASGAWLSNHLFEYYEYSLDKNFLEEISYPIMKGAAKFYLTQIIEDETGDHIIFPSTSPENDYVCDGGEASISETTEMTMACVRELFAKTLIAAKILGDRDETVKKVEMEVSRLRKTKVGSDGRILEWYEEKEETEINHRHVSHLYGLYPGNEISSLTEPRLAAAAEKTLAVRGDEGTGWSLAWKAIFYARLFNGNKALELIKKQLRPCQSNDVNYTSKGGTYPNLTCAHPPFQIDGNFGVLAAITEMLVSSDFNTVHLIPALPDEWKSAEVKDIRIKGGRSLSFTLCDGDIAECKIFGNAPCKIFIAGEEKTELFENKNGITVYKAK